MLGDEHGFAPVKTCSHIARTGPVVRETATRGKGKARGGNEGEMDGP